MFKNLFDYLIIKKSGLFDSVFYLLNNPDVRKADIDPLGHFVKTGWKESRNPSSSFNVIYYLNQNLDVKGTNINPLVHYLKFGKKEGRKEREDIAVMTANKQSNNNACQRNLTTSIKANKPKEIMMQKNLFDKRFVKKIDEIQTSKVVDIIVLVGPNHAMFEDCFVSIKRFTDPKKYKLHIVAHEKDYKNIEKLSANDIEIHLHNMDLFNYSRANNIVLKNCSNDVVLLNDDTEVTPGWLEKLQHASRGVALTGAHTDPHCSGNPQMWGQGPVTPTYYPINMFCAYIPKRLREVVGLLDEEFVYYGGEDVDYSIRTLLNGFPLIISDAFVFHKDNQSYRESKEDLMRVSDKIIMERYGIQSPFYLSSIKPIVSVIIATRNRPELLTLAVESVENNEYDNYEIIIVDDASSSETSETILKLQNTFKNIISIRLPTNVGLAKARAVGLNASKGKFVLFSDDDDTVLKNRISKPLEYIIQHPTLDVVYCAYNLVNSPGVEIPTYCRPFNLSDYLELKFNIGSGILLGRKKVFIDVPFQSTYNHALDYDWVFRLIRRGFNIDYCPEIVMNYNRMGPASEHLAGTETALNQHKQVYEREILLKKQTRVD